MNGSNDHEETVAAGVTRRQLLSSGGALAGLLATGGDALAAVRPTVRHGQASAASASPGAAPRFRSRPDLHPPSASVRVAHPHTAAGYLFMGPQAGDGAQAGALIMDDSGEPVFFQPVPSSTPDWATNVGVQTYQKKPALVAWEGTVVSGYGHGTAMILDDSYRELVRVRAAQGRWIDLHEFQLTPQGTALFTCHPPTVEHDLSSIGGPKTGHLIDSGFQEVDLRTGRLLLEWRGLDHIAISESYLPLGKPWDYLHLNSIDVLPDGNLLVSARHTFALYKLDRKTGKVLWRLGGKRSDFEMGRGTEFAWQHDGRHVGTSKISVFDDGPDPGKNLPPRSRGLMLNVDYKHKRVAMEHQYLHPNPLVAIAMGNTQTLQDGHVIVGWGTVPYLSEFTADGRLLFDMQFPSACPSYRAFRFPWTGVPSDPPAIATTTNARTGESVLYASWNGATNVARWQILSGSSPTQLKSAATVARNGFETSIPLGRASGYVAVAALDASGRRLATSAVTKL